MEFSFFAGFIEMAEFNEIVEFWNKLSEYLEKFSSQIVDSSPCSGTSLCDQFFSFISWVVVFFQKDAWAYIDCY